MITYISPLNSINLLSQIEMDTFNNIAHSDLYRIFRNCSLSVLNSVNKISNKEKLLKRFRNFDINIVRYKHSIKLELINPPEEAFVDGHMIRSLRVNLFAILRDILFFKNYFSNTKSYDCSNLESDSNSKITNLVFSMLRNARAFHINENPNIVICWGGRFISNKEYYYAFSVGKELGLRKLNICTGCGLGVMEAIMKGAAVGHARQQYKESRFIGITEPSIISFDSINSLVNELIIMPDIEKRLEAFVRIGHSIIIFPGGVGTAEEFLYLLSIMMSPKNKNKILPLVLTGPKESSDYFRIIDTFILNTLGPKAQNYYSIVINDPIKVAQIIKKSMLEVKDYRARNGDTYGFNWSIYVPKELQYPIKYNRKNIYNINLCCKQPNEYLAIALRGIFSEMLSNSNEYYDIKNNHIQQNIISLLQGDTKITKNINNLLNKFINQNRIRNSNIKSYSQLFC